MHGFLGVPILIRGEPYGNLYLTEKAAGDFDESNEEAVVVLADWAAIAISNARSYAAAEGRRKELERAVATFEATAEIARALAGETDLDRVLELIVKRGRALTDARAMMVVLERGEEFGCRGVNRRARSRSPWPAHSGRGDGERPRSSRRASQKGSPTRPGVCGLRSPSRRTHRPA